MQIALTGGMGCGKSFVLGCFAERGWTTIETDAITRQLLTDDPEVSEALRNCFGEVVFSPDGRIDRAAVARRVFSDAEALRALEEILHPRIRSRWERLSRESVNPVIVEIPLLFEKKLEKNFELSVCVTASRQIQLLRLARRGVDRADALRRIGSQLPVQEKERRADYVISNNGEASFTRAQVHLLIERILS